MQVKSYDDALDFLPQRAASAKSHGLLWAVAAFFKSLSDGIAASREYERLKASGVPSDKAAREAFHMLTKPAA